MLNCQNIILHYLKLMNSVSAPQHGNTLAQHLNFRIAINNKVAVYMNLPLHILSFSLSFSFVGDACMLGWELKHFNI